MAITWITGLMSGDNLSSYNFGNVNVPVNCALALIVVGRGTSGSIDSVTVGGVATTLYSNIGPNDVACGAVREVTAGSYGIVVNLSAAILRCGVGIWTVTDYASPVPIDTDSTIAGGGTSQLTLDFGTDGMACYGGFHGNHTNEASWSAATERFDATPESNARIAFADKVASGSGDVETINWLAASNNASAAMVFAPGGGATPTPYPYALFI